MNTWSLVSRLLSYFKFKGDDCFEQPWRGNTSIWIWCIYVLYKLISQALRSRAKMETTVIVMLNVFNSLLARYCHPVARSFVCHPSLIFRLSCQLSLWAKCWWQSAWWLTSFAVLGMAWANTSLQLGNDSKIQTSHTYYRYIYIYSYLDINTYSIPSIPLFQ